MTAHRTHILCLVIEKNRPVFYFVLVPRSPPLVLAIAKKLAVIFQSGLPFGPSRRQSSRRRLENLHQPNTIHILTVKIKKKGKYSINYFILYIKYQVNLKENQIFAYKKMYKYFWIIY